mgnify:CR=1 FL=1
MKDLAKFKIMSKENNNVIHKNLSKTTFSLVGVFKKCWTKDSVI